MSIGQKVTLGLIALTIVLTGVDLATSGIREIAAVVADKSFFDLALMAGLAAAFIIPISLLNRKYIAPAVDPAILQAAISLQKSLGLRKDDE